ESPRSDRGLRFLHRADGYVPAAVLLFRHRAWTTEDSALQRDPPPDGRMGSATTAGGLSRSGSVPLRGLRPRLEIRWRRRRLFEGDGSEAQADEHPVALAEWHRGK